MGYKKIHYNALTEAYKQRFKLSNHDLTHGQWMGILNEITSIFDDGILITEALDAFDEASYEKRKWPTGTLFFKRVHQAALKNKREHSATKSITNDGVKSIGELMKERFNL